MNGPLDQQPRIADMAIKAIRNCPPQDFTAAGRALCGRGRERRSFIALASLEESRFAPGQGVLPRMEHGESSCFDTLCVCGGGLTLDFPSLNISNANGQQKDTLSV